MPTYVLKFQDGREDVKITTTSRESAAAQYLSAYRGKYADAPLFAVVQESGEGSDDPLVVDPPRRSRSRDARKTLPRFHFRFELFHEIEVPDGEPPLSNEVVIRAESICEAVTNFLNCGWPDGDGKADNIKCFSVERLK